MTNKLVFATNNTHKLREIKEIVGDHFEIIRPADLGITEEIPETGHTLAENALQKATFIHSRTGLNCFADDTGLEVDALNGDPGVYSARYAGNQASFEDNMNKLLAQMEGKGDRKARFRTVIALILDGEHYFFEGAVEGEILARKSGHGGFGYDPVFQPSGYQTSFAQMDPEVKNTISHRGISVRKLADFLQSQRQYTVPSK